MSFLHLVAFFFSSTLTESDCPLRAPSLWPVGSLGYGTEGKKNKKQCCLFRWGRRKGGSGALIWDVLLMGARSEFTVALTFPLPLAGAVQLHAALRKPTAGALSALGREMKALFELAGPFLSGNFCCLGKKGQRRAILRACASTGRMGFFHLSWFSGSTFCCFSFIYLFILYAWFIKRREKDGGTERIQQLGFTVNLWHLLFINFFLGGGYRAQCRLFRFSLYPPWRGIVCIE